MSNKQLSSVGNCLTDPLSLPGIQYFILWSIRQFQLQAVNCSVREKLVIGLGNKIRDFIAPFPNKIEYRCLDPTGRCRDVTSVLTKRESCHSAGVQTNDHVNSGPRETFMKPVLESCPLANVIESNTKSFHIDLTIGDPFHRTFIAKQSKRKPTDHFTFTIIVGGDNDFIKVRKALFEGEELALFELSQISPIVEDIVKPLDIERQIFHPPCCPFRIDLLWHL
ncbi:hypothetical protein TH24_16730 [Thalassospira xiamenensis]|nr:hypothetical protein TH24_16730 [Thalassospira xiamenensis]